jgi:hypothetical protein
MEFLVWVAGKFSIKQAGDRAIAKYALDIDRVLHYNSPHFPRSVARHESLQSTCPRLGNPYATALTRTMVPRG